MTLVSPQIMLLTVLLLVLCATLPNHTTAFMPSFNQPCRAYQCTSSSQTPVPKKDFVFTANGCGTAALPISTKTDFSDCCNWHDACYSTCGMKKATCEKRLDKCMRAKCALIVDDASEREQCESTTKLFALGAQMVGCPAYQDAQKQACRCVSKTKAPRAIRERLVQFLKANDAPANDLEDDQVDALLEKYKGQEPKMFLRLVVKYPNAIQVDTTKRNYMDDIFKKPDVDGFQGMPKDKYTVTLDEDGADNQNNGDKHEELHVDEHIEL